MGLSKQELSHLPALIAIVVFWAVVGWMLWAVLIGTR